MYGADPLTAAHPDRRKPPQRYGLIAPSYSWDVDLSGSGGGGGSSGSGSGGGSSLPGAASGSMSNAAGTGSGASTSSFAPASPYFQVGHAFNPDDDDDDDNSNKRGWRSHRRVRISRTGVEDDEEYRSRFQLDHLEQYGTPTVTQIVEAVLARVRTVGEAAVAPDSVHESVRRMRRRKSMAPPSWLHLSSHSDDISASSSLDGTLASARSSPPLSESFFFWRGKANRGLAKHAKQPRLLSDTEAPASVGHATSMLVRDSAGVGAGPRANIQLTDVLRSSMTIGTAASGGPHEVVSTPLQEPFSVFVPPPFRIIFLVALGLLCWSANLRGLRRLGLDADGMMSGDAKTRVLPHHRSRAEQLHSSSASIATTTTTTTTTTNTSSTAQNGRHHAGSADSELAVFFRLPGQQETASLHLGLICLIWGIVCWVSYRLYAFQTVFYGADHTGGFAHARGRHAQALQGIAILGLVAVALWPGDVLYLGRRRAFGRMILRIASPSLYQHIHFSHVVLADILTSFARVFGDLWLTMCFLWPTSESPAWWNGKGSIAVPLLVSLPYLIRFRQCLSEYNIASTQGSSRKAQSFKPLYNAAKYFSAFPVIWLSVLQTKGGTGQDAASDSSSSTTFYLWALSVFVNSLYSFWWDVTNDWGLEMLTWDAWSATPSLLTEGVRSLHKRSTSAMPRLTKGHGSGAGASPQLGVRTLNGHFSANGPLSSTTLSASSLSGHGRKESYFLRAPEQAMLFPPLVYQLAVTCDLLLRFAWSLKLSSHLHHIIELESTAFYLEALEIVRRWMWTYLRVEWEACKRRSWDAEDSMESLTLSTLRSDAHAAAAPRNGDAQRQHHLD